MMVVFRIIVHGSFRKSSRSGFIADLKDKVVGTNMKAESNE